MADLADKSERRLIAATRLLLAPRSLEWITLEEVVRVMTDVEGLDLTTIPNCLLGQAARGERVDLAAVLETLDHAWPRVGRSRSRE